MGFTHPILIFRKISLLYFSLKKRNVAGWIQILWCDCYIVYFLLSNKVVDRYPHHHSTSNSTWSKKCLFILYTIIFKRKYNNISIRNTLQDRNVKLENSNGAIYKIKQLYALKVFICQIVL